MVLCLLLALAATATPAAAVPVRVVVTAGGQIDLPRDSHVIAAGPEGVVARAPLPSWEEDVWLNVPVGTKQISAEAAGLWCSSSPVDGRVASDEPWRVSCWRAGRVRGTVVSVGKGAEVGELTLRFHPKGSPKAGEVWPAGAVKLLVRSGAWEAELPVGLLDLDLRSQGFAARYLFDVTVDPENAKDVGAIELRRGASLVGSVEVSGAGRLKPEQCLITLRPDGDEPRGPNGEGTARTSRTARPTARGFFQFEGVAPGRWRLVSSQPGLAEAVRTVEIADGLEASLNSHLILGELRKIELRVKPPRDPEGEIWTAEVLEARTGAAPERVVETPLAADGSWTYDRMVVGRRYFVRLKTSRGLGWWRDEEPFEMTATNQQRSIEVGIEKVRGTVFLGRRPLAADLVFGQEGRFPAIRMEADASGRFEGKLPRIGAWRLSVRSAIPVVARSVDVDVPEPGDGGVSDIEVRLPGGGLQGEIVDERGNRVPNAVLRTRARGSREANNELIPDGTFLLEGLADGEYVFSADTRTAECDAVLVSVRDGETEEPLRLVLLPLHAIRGRTVISPGVGLPRARVEQLPVVGADASRAALPAAEMDGRWIVRIPSSRSSACLIHASPGYATRMLRMEPRPEEQEVLLAQSGGQLVLNATKMPLGGPFPALFHQGCMSYQRALQGPGGASESEEKGVVRVQGLFEPGDYSLCMITYDEYSTYTGGRPAFAACTHGFLLPGAQLELRAPDR